MILAGLLLVACSRVEKRKTDEVVQTPSVRNVVPLTPMKFGPISVDEVRTLFPQLENMRPIHEIRMAEDRQQVAWNLCLQDGDAGSAETAIQSGLKRAGWQNVRLHQSEHTPNKQQITAGKPPYNLTGELKRQSAGLCKTDEALVGLLVYRLVPKEPSAGAEPSRSL